MSKTFWRAGVLCAALSILFLAGCRRCHKCDTVGASYTCEATEAPPSQLGHTEAVPPEVQPKVVVPENPRTPEVKPQDVKPPEVKVTEVKPPEIPRDKPPAPPPVENVAKNVFKPVRIRAGTITSWTDKHGNSWLADSGFTDGAMVDRGKIGIENTDIPELYTTERCCMESFSWPVPNGKYTLKLHFAETFDEVKKPGDRTFGLDVNGEKVREMDIFKEAGGANRALVKTFHVDAKNGKIEIQFTKKDSKEPEINGIEILPE